MTSAAEDYISSLSDDVLHSILVRLPIKQQVETSILSRRWRSLWSLNPLFLDLGSTFGRDALISPPSLLNLLRQWRSSHLHKLRAPILSSTIDPVVTFAAEKSVIDLSIISCHRKKTYLPRCFFSHRSSRNLAALSLQGDLELFPFPTWFHGFSSLRSLFLKDVWISSAQLALLLSLSPLLESLGLVYTYDLEIIVLDSSSRITDLELRNCVGLRRIDAGGSCLRKLTCERVNKVVVDHIPSLEEAALFGCYEVELLLKLSHAPVIYLDTFFTYKSARVFPKGTAERLTIFNNVRELHLNLDDLKYQVLQSLAMLLKHCPFLQKLYIEMGNNGPMKGRDGNLYDELLCYVPEWKRKLAFQVLSFQPLNHLKFVSLRNLLDTCSQLDLVKYLLDKGTVLQTLSVVAFRGRKEIIAKELALFAHSSANIHISITGQPRDPKTEDQYISKLFD